MDPCTCTGATLGSLKLAEQLHNAVERNNTAAVKVLIAGGANVNDVGFGNISPLHRAAQKGFIDIGRQLLEAKANVEAVNRDGQRALHLAIKFGFPEFVKLLVEEGHADTFAYNVESSTPLHLAAARGSEEMIEALLSRKRNEASTSSCTTKAMLEAADGNGRTPLRVAIKCAKERAASVLITHDHRLLCSSQAKGPNDTKMRRRWAVSIDNFNAIVQNKMTELAVSLIEGDMQHLPVVDTEDSNENSDSSSHVAAPLLVCEPLFGFNDFEASGEDESDVDTNSSAFVQEDRHDSSECPPVISAIKNGNVVVLGELLRYIHAYRSAALRAEVQQMMVPSSCGCEKLLPISTLKNGGRTLSALSKAYGFTRRRHLLFPLDGMLNIYEATPIEHSFIYSDPNSPIIIEIIKLLVDSGLGDLSRPSTGNPLSAAGNTPLHSAVAANAYEGLRIILKSDFFNHLTCDASHHHVETNKDSRGSLTINCKGTIGIHILASAHSPSEVISRKNKFGDAPLSTAVSCGFASIAALLLPFGCDTETKDAIGRTPLWVAVERGSAKLSDLLLTHGSDIGVLTTTVSCGGLESQKVTINEVLSDIAGIQGFALGKAVKSVLLENGIAI